MELEDCLNEFTYIFVRSLEEKLKYWQKYLEDRPDKLNTSKPGTIFSAAALAIPQIGKGLSRVVKQGDQYVQNRAEKDTAQSMAEITYFSDNNKDAFRLILIEGALEVFRKYEYQFSLVSCKGGVLRAMQKLGSDAAHRIISFLLKDKTVKNLTPELVAEGIVLGKSPRNYKKVVTNGRTLAVNEETLSTADFFANTGIRIENDGVITYYRNKESFPVLRHRLLFAWEDRDLIRSTYEVDRPEYSYKYRFNLNSTDEQVEKVRQFITTKDPIEDVKEFIRVRDDELESLIATANEEIKEIHAASVNENREHHHLTRETIAKTEESIITYLNGMIFETLKRTFEEDRRRREEYDLKRWEEEEKRKRIEEEERRRREDEDRRLREEEERRRKEEAEMLIERVKEQQQLPSGAIVIDGDKIAEQGKKLEECFHREGKKVEREARRIKDQFRGLFK